MKNLITAILLVFSLTASFNVSAALVDNGSFTTDTAQGLDWLDLSETSGLSYSEALAANTGWRLATNSEVEALFSVAFDGFLSTNSGGSAVYQENDEPNPYRSTMLGDILNWEALFGYSYIEREEDGGYPTPYLYSSIGLYQDETNNTRMMGTYSDPAWQEWEVYGTDYVVPEYYNFDLADYAESGNRRLGVFLVKATVPIPAPILLFGSALAALWVRRKAV